MSGLSYLEKLLDGVDVGWERVSQVNWYVELRYR